MHSSKKECEIRAPLEPTSNVTVVITSFNRSDLLLRTLNSFFKFNTYPIKEVIITEDSGVAHANNTIKAAYPHLTYIDGTKRIGQVLSIDRAYARVTTPYVFHLEEDWEFYKPDFIQKSLEILEKLPNVSLVICEAHGRYQPQIKDKRLARNINPAWGYYSFNPGLRRISDYKKVCPGGFGNYTVFRPHRPVKSEKKINDLFRKNGYVMGILNEPQGHLKHIGIGRHVE